MKHIYILGLILVTMFSCTQKTKTIIPKGAYPVTIDKSAGELWEKTDQYLPLPVNIGHHDDKEVFVISDKKEQLSEIAVLPIGAVKYEENQKLKTIILSIPFNKEDRTVSVSDFDEFSTIHSSVKWIIEQYLVNRLGTKQTTIKSWENETFAINYLLN